MGSGPFLFAPAFPTIAVTIIASYHHGSSSPALLGKDWSEVNHCGLLLPSLAASLCLLDAPQELKRNQLPQPSSQAPLSLLGPPSV